MSISPYDRDLYRAFTALACEPGAVGDGFARWLGALPEQLANGLDRKRHADLKAWHGALEKLPALPDAREVQLEADRVGARFPTGLTSGQLRQSENLLRAMMPWRKGPYQLDEIHIDTEWRSDWKWQRLAPHLSNLTHRRVLDVGGGNGYHGWRMVGAGAAFTLVIDPSPRFYCQFHAVRHFIGADHPQGRNLHFLPVGIEDVPAKMGAFDTVFSMGVLYHRPSPMDHLFQLRDTLRPGGELVLETLVVEGDVTTVLMPGERYAAMPNVYFLPSSQALAHWCERAGFKDVRIVDEAVTTLDEQRATDWMTYHSLSDFLDPTDPSLTREGHPAPRRAVLIATRA
ncbi:MULTISPECIES: tRNA 5-methoxyuridine(34)/uridine 5-oxyacetic acid(34) synthase CmoB [unclassified Cobetia]|uniref:tRNA 5-methoxyuridine(34)/uridine 5-oxyacetic acid(34) synthase CmoB n=1 Tax=unclassified Cobetia TaxID=2609414 RepID=UPI00159E5DF1|nr:MULTISPECIES: tRNA 5-methoxyuridine(34)/uridine 5-oxyacetic acid(34) synthase CmoB [unclassified Cobetia]MCO7231950.1 tRNA 5-methoxyuridine(34)/uridine 5-oxyacetic acid(34) synthase CmoB [Cobetia sp. Dlab-2-AX]MCO7234734.1 tRNA 5-methoxyuridine(34)/uridine 5-oxyacetic acid(34) synthase CmoB [Cobetia sp. Dlab-2-U]NVN55283.1 tRNA 5-methoxyuridine(34)/uridine 5-oxyacetic acid(34) synthase CmoB [bacterium Scap17]